MLICDITQFRGTGMWRHIRRLFLHAKLIFTLRVTKYFLNNGPSDSFYRTIGPVIILNIQNHLMTITWKVSREIPRSFKPDDLSPRTPYGVSRSRRVNNQLPQIANVENDRKCRFLDPTICSTI